MKNPLSFIGSGSAFNTKLGNNSAFIKKDDKLFLIDCGSSTFHRLKESGLLEGVNNIYVLITHLHPDHVGSLGDLIFYNYFCMGKPQEISIELIIPTGLRVKDMLIYMGVTPETYNLTEVLVKSDKLEFENIKVECIRTHHVKELDCYGYIIYYKGITIYYSGDSNIIPYKILDMMNYRIIDVIYQDTSSLNYDGNVHLSLNNLAELVTNTKHRNIIHCMHLDEGFDNNYAQHLGFNVVENIISKY